MTESRPDGYTIYCEWCVAHNRVPPTREWWDNACTEVPASDILSNEEVMKLLSDDQADIDTERREGWSYGE